MQAIDLIVLFRSAFVFANLMNAGNMIYPFSNTFTLSMGREESGMTLDASKAAKVEGPELQKERRVRHWFMASKVVEIFTSFAVLALGGVCPASLSTPTTAFRLLLRKAPDSGGPLPPSLTLFIAAVTPPLFVLFFAFVLVKASRTPLGPRAQKWHHRFFPPVRSAGTFSRHFAGSMSALLVLVLANSAMWNIFANRLNKTAVTVRASHLAEGSGLKQLLSQIDGWGSHGTRDAGKTLDDLLFRTDPYPAFSAKIENNRATLEGKDFAKAPVTLGIDELRAISFVMKADHWKSDILGLQLRSDELMRAARALKAVAIGLRNAGDEQMAKTLLQLARLSAGTGTFDGDVLSIVALRALLNLSPQEAGFSSRDLSILKTLLLIKGAEPLSEESAALPETCMAEGARVEIAERHGYQLFLKGRPWTGIARRLERCTAFQPQKGARHRVVQQIAKIEEAFSIGFPTTLDVVLLATGARFAAKEASVASLQNIPYFSH